MASIQTAGRQRIEWIPLDQLRRPIVPVIDEQKVHAMIQTLASTKNDDNDDDGLPPVDVLVVNKGDRRLYFAFGGCHRLRAYEEAGRTRVKCKLVPATERMIRTYTGTSDVFA